MGVRSLAVFTSRKTQVVQKTKLLTDHKGKGDQPLFKVFLYESCGDDKRIKY